MNRIIGAALLLFLAGMLSCSKKPDTIVAPAPGPDSTKGQSKDTASRMLDAAFIKFVSLDQHYSDITEAGLRENMPDDSTYFVFLNDIALPQDPYDKTACYKQFERNEVDPDAPMRWRIRMKLRDEPMDFSCDLRMPSLQLVVRDTISRSAGAYVPYTTTGSEAHYYMTVNGQTYTDSGKNGAFTIPAAYFKDVEPYSTVEIYFYASKTISPVSGSYRLNFSKYFYASKLFVCGP